MINVCLAGSMTEFLKNGEFEESIRWREILDRQLQDSNIKVFDPTLHFDINKDWDISGILPQNRLYLEKCDILIVNLKYLDKSPGTLWEMSVANYLNKPIIAFNATDWITYPHINSMITIHLKDVEEIYLYLTSMYSQL
jgi:nucleoside 2-deoxyribosyltransferase